MRERPNRFISGKTIEEKFESIETTLQHFKRRLQKTVIGVIPPTVIFSYVKKPEPDGTIVKCLLPADGIVTRVCMAVSEYEGSGTVRFNCKIEGNKVVGPNRSTNLSFDTRRPVIVQDIGAIVTTGDYIVLSTTEPERVKGVFISILYEIKLKDNNIKAFLIDEFDKLLEEPDERI